MPAERIIWTVSAEFAVVSGPAGRGYGEGCCGGCLPILIRRALRRSRGKKWPAPVVLPGPGIACTVQEPHPAPTTPPEGFTCPRPLTGPCLDATCDHD